MKKIMVLVLTLALFLASVPFAGLAAHDTLSDKTVSVTVAALNGGGKVYCGDYNWSYTDRTIERGTEITLEARETTGKFLYWRDDTYTDKERILSTELTYTFTVINNFKISAVFLAPVHLEGKGYVTFSDINGRIYLEQGVEAGDRADAPSVSFIDNSGYSIAGWNSDAWKNVESGEIYLINPAYEKKENTYAVNAEGGMLEPSKVNYSYDEEVKVTLDKGAIPMGKKFAGWKINGEIVSLNETLRVKVGSNMNIAAAYEIEEAEVLPKTSIIDVSTEAAANGASFLAYRFLPEGYDLIESGFLFAPDSYEGDLILDQGSVTNVRAYGNAKDGMFRFNKLIAGGMGVRAVSYIIYKYNDTLYITYSAEKTITK